MITDWLYNKSNAIASKRDEIESTPTAALLSDCDQCVEIPLRNWIVILSRFE
jgi:hypothetical protein